MIAFVGYNLFANEWHPAIRILNYALQERGIKPFEFQRVSMDDKTIVHLKAMCPDVIVALGNSALRKLVKDVPPVHLCRGYVFDSEVGPVVATVDPADINKVWVPWRMLLSLDIQRAKDIAKDGLTRPERNVEVLL